MKLKFKTAARAAVAAGIMAAASLTGMTAAHATTDQLYVEIINHEHTNICLNISGGLSVCNSSDPTLRFDVVSWASDVNGYYSRVVLEAAHNTSECLTWTYSDGDQLRLLPCNGSASQHWDMTWVGNGNGNPSNSFQFYNPSTPSSNGGPGCLDEGQSNVMYNDPGPAYCTNPANKYQIWSMVN